MAMNDISFEDAETPYTQDAARRRTYGQKLSTRKSMPNIIPTAMSTLSSDATAVTNQSGETQWGNEDHIVEDDNGVSEYGNDTNYYNFKTNQNYFDKAIQNHRDSRSPTKRSNQFAHQFNNIFNSEEQTNGHFLKHPRSMMEINPRVRNNDNGSHLKTRYGSLASNDKLKSSISHGNLKQPTRLNSVRFKHSVTKVGDIGSTHISPIREATDADWEFENDSDNDMEPNDTVVITRDDAFLNKFSEGNDIDDNLVEQDHDGFILNDEVLQPQFLSQSSSRWNRQQPTLSSRYNAQNQLKEIRKNKSGPLKGSPVSRIQTIKQTIDSNSPNTGNDNDDESIYYNPRTQQWDSDTNGLNNKFTGLNINGRHPIPQQSNKESYNLKNIKLRSNSRKPTVVNNMVLDEKNQRWVSISGDDPDPFANIHDFPSQTIHKEISSPFLRSQSTQEDPMFRKATDRYSKQYSSLGKMVRRTRSQVFEIDPTYSVDSHSLEKFYHEENRWHKLISGWFLMGTDNSRVTSTKKTNISIDKNVSLTSKDNKDFMYEIRKMVMNSTRQ